MFAARRLAPRRASRVRIPSRLIGRMRRSVQNRDRPLRPLPEPDRRLVTIDGEHWPAQVIGWRGYREDITWRTGIGKTHVGFVDASQVQRDRKSVV